VMTIGNQTSTRFKDEIRIVAPWGFLLCRSDLPGDGCAGCGPRRQGSQVAPPLALRCLLGVVAGALLGCYVVLIGYINRDAGRRRMSRLLWTLVAIFVPTGSGSSSISSCASRAPPTARNAMADVEPGFSFCPRCRNRLQPVCPPLPARRKSRDKFCPLLRRSPGDGWLACLPLRRLPNREHLRIEPLARFVRSSDRPSAPLLNQRLSADLLDSHCKIECTMAGGK